MQWPISTLLSISPDPQDIPLLLILLPYQNPRSYHSPPPSPIGHRDTRILGLGLGRWDSTRINEKPVPSHRYGGGLSGYSDCIQCLFIKYCYKYQYIHALNGGINQTTTAINGLTITNCGGRKRLPLTRQSFPADMIPDKFVLEIQPPSDHGLKNITIYAQNGVGFTRNGNLITGSPTGVHLESEDIAPPEDFLPVLGHWPSLTTVPIFHPTPVTQSSAPRSPRVSSPRMTQNSRKLLPVRPRLLSPSELHTRQPLPRQISPQVSR